MSLVKRNFILLDYSQFDAQNREVFLSEDVDCDTSLDKFHALVMDAIDAKKHFPVIRIADGEFQFLLGKDEFNLRKPILFLIRNLIGELVRKLLKQKF